jgi:two-component system, NarL family, nitrate/nitrite response regulator NarL
VDAAAFDVRRAGSPYARRLPVVDRDGGRMIEATVLIADAHRLFADVVASALEDLGARVVDRVGTGADAIAVVLREEPDVVLVDLGLPDVPGIEAGRAILEARPDTVLVALAASDDRRESAIALRAGFRGYVPKHAHLRSVVKVIRHGLDGRVVVIPPSSPSTSTVDHDSPASLMASGLTIREREVLALIVAGAGSVEIADRLNISTNTVRTHVQGILTKLQVHSRLEAAAFAVRHGLLEGKGWPSRNAALDRPSG